MPAVKRRICSRCKIAKIENANKTGLCRPCYRISTQAAAPVPAPQTVDLLERRLKGEPDPVDELRRENTSLRQDLHKAKLVIASADSRVRLEDRLFDEILGFITKNPYRPVLKKPGKRSGGADAHEMLLLESDAHFPEVVEPEATFGLKYDADICLRRMEYLRDKVIRYHDLRAKSYPVDKLTVAVNGDMLSGNIHEELEITNQLPMSEALTKMAYALYDQGLAFASVFAEVEFIVMPGNHPRITQKPRFKQKWDNWEHVMGLFLQALAGDKFKVTVPRDSVYRHKIFDKVVGVTHGDGVKAQSFAGIPWYSMKQRRDALQALLRQVREQGLDMLCYGHFHQLIYEEGQGCSLVINGSIKGGDEYSVGTRYAAQTPVQALLTFHPSHGLTDLSRINLAPTT